MNPLKKKLTSGVIGEWLYNNSGHPLTKQFEITQTISENLIKWVKFYRYWIVRCRVYWTIKNT